MFRYPFLVHHVSGQIRRVDAQFFRIRAEFFPMKHPVQDGGQGVEHVLRDMAARRARIGNELLFVKALHDFLHLPDSQSEVTVRIFL